MTRKTYKTFRLKGLSIPLTIDGNTVHVDFKAGCSATSTATYVTSNPKIQEAMESLFGFNRDYYIDRIVELEAESPKYVAPVVTPEPEIEEDKEVVDMLDAQTFKNLVELRNALADKGIDVSKITNVKAAESLAKKNGYNYTVEKNA